MQDSCGRCVAAVAPAHVHKPQRSRMGDRRADYGVRCAVNNNDAPLAGAFLTAMVGGGGGRVTLRPSSPERKLILVFCNPLLTIKARLCLTCSLGFQNAKERTYEVGSSLYRRTY